MIPMGEWSEIEFYKRLRSLCLSEEYFYSLPIEIQKVIISNIEIKKKNEIRKKIALKQYDLEEKVKEKVLSFLKKKG